MVNVTSPEKVTKDEPTMSPPRPSLRLTVPSAAAAATDNGYEDDFLDMHCDDMDLF